MATLTEDDCLKRLRNLWKEAFHVHDEPEDSVVLNWAFHPESWAEHAVRNHGKSWHMAEAVVRHCRSLRTRAARAVTAKAQSATGEDAFDSLIPTPPTAEGTA
jgi:hypothetical protein